MDKKTGRAAGKRGRGGIFSIGYEKKDIGTFLATLVKNDIDVLADVRHNPFSMKFAFIGRRLSESLKKEGIDYMHIPELGIEGRHRKGLETPSDYKRLFSFYRKSILAANGEKVEMLRELGRSRRVALMCFEMDKGMCHRGVICERLEELSGAPVTHL